MELIVDKLPNFKHFCKICKKGFLCGSALGGHMRAHGISDEEKTIDCNKRMYALRTNLSRQRFNRICENCGDEFSSLKCFLEHGKCKFDDVNSSVTCPKLNEDTIMPYGWSKRKRSFETNIPSSTKLNDDDCTSSVEEDLANCLLMLSNTNRLKKSCTSTCKEDLNERQSTFSIIAPTITKTCTPPNIDHKVILKGVNNVVSTNTKSMYECKACKRVFSSHQALGGHRASHKKVKGCFAARLDHVDQDNIDQGEDSIRTCNLESIRPSASEKGKSNPSLTMSKKKSKIHECSICHRVFSSGQALGGHKRCHWITSNDPSMFGTFKQLGDQSEVVKEVTMFNQSSHFSLDLNDIPSQHEEMMRTSQSTKSLLSFELSTDILLQSHANNCDQENNSNANLGDNMKKLGSNNNKVLNKEDANSKIELVKLCEIKNDLNSNCSSSHWLQVGIGSNSVVIDNP